MFGCDAKATSGGWFITCPSCQAQGCDKCDEGRIIYQRCPSIVMGPGVFDSIREWQIVKLHKLWPRRGGLDNQSAWFVDVVSFLDGELAAKQERERRAAEAKLNNGRKRT